MFKINTNQMTVWIYRNLKTLLAICILCLFTGLSFVVWYTWQNKQEELAKNSLYRFERSLQELTKEDQEDPKDILSRLQQQNKEYVLTNEMKTQATAYELAIKQYQNFKSTSYFVIDLSSFYYRYGEKQKAKDLLSIFASGLKPNTLDQLIATQLASYYMNDKDCEKALRLLSDLIANKKAEPFHLESRLQKAICLENLKRYPEALTEYKSLSIENPNTYLGRQAKDYERLLSLKQKLEQQ